MATLAAMTDAVLDMVYGIARIERPAEDTLDNSVDSTGDVTWEFVTPALWKKYDYAEDQAAGEMVIMSTDHPADGNDVTVRRAQNGTTALAAYATTAVFYKNPVFPRYRIERFINETVNNDLFPHVWMVGETTVSYTVGETTYEMPTDCGDVLQVYQADLDSDSRFYPIDTMSWEYVPVVAAAESTNQNYLRLKRVFDQTDTVYVTYKQKPTSSSLSDLSTSLAAMVPWRVVGKLLAGTRLTPARAAPGRATPILNQSGSQLTRDFAAFDVEFRRMRKDEHNRLEKQVPIQKRFQRSRVWIG